MRLLLVSTHRKPEFETLSAADYFALHPYSVGAILHNLELRGWQTRRLGIRSTVHPGRLIRAINDFRPDIIYTYGSLTALNPVWLRRLCRHRSYKVVHGWDDVYGEIWHDVYGWLPGRLMDIMERAIIRQSDGVVTLSRYNQERGRKWGVESVYIPNGADVPSYDPSKCPIRLEGRLKLVYTGDQARWKRTWEICAAMADLPKDIKLYLTGGHYPYLDKYASENCIFLGYLPKNDQLSVMAQADVLVITANQDCNAKIQEYLRFGKPILGYDGRPNLFFTNGHNALLTRDYRSAILRLANDPGLRARLAANARDLPVLTWAEIAAQFDDYFRSLLEGTCSLP
ncbi:MAG: glycosyltransferase family 4 protein [Lentisphaerae bacterium]|jgi:glycosyltransferase involved in cell wall biosynthesis|nr:glycosyltransferase family 4 protein [Lentisphaerota bacterium]